jgi:hypothetical protein
VDKTELILRLHQTGDTPVMLKVNGDEIRVLLFESIGVVENLPMVATDGEKVRLEVLSGGCTLGESISKSFLYFYPNSFFSVLFSHDPLSYFASGTLNLFLYAFKLFH